MAGYILTLYILINIIVLVGILVDADCGANFSFVNPFVIYENIKVNWFGAVLLTILANVCLPVCAIPYWIYKLSTVGRK